MYIFFLSVGAGDTKWHFASMLHLPHYYCHMCVYVPHASRGFDVPLSSALVIFMAKHISQYVYIVHILHIQHSRLRGNHSTFLFCGWRDVIANFCYAISLGKVREKQVCSIMIDWLMFYYDIKCIKCKSDSKLKTGLGIVQQYLFISSWNWYLTWKEGGIKVVSSAGCGMELG